MLSKSVGKSKKPLKKKSLTTTSSLKSNLSKPKPRKKLDEKTAQQLVKIADEAFSKYIRLRDGKWVDGKLVCACIDCGKVVVSYEDGRWRKGIENGHYITRGIMTLRYDEMNCNTQASYCNAWRDKGDVYKDYTRAVDKKYGKGVSKELRATSKLDGSRKIPPKDELLDIIYTCRAYIKRTLGE
jgi:Bacteriophage Lambda NinG protein